MSQWILVKCFARQPVFVQEVAAFLFMTAQTWFLIFFYVWFQSHCSFGFLHSQKNRSKTSPLPRSLPLHTNFGSDLRHIGNENKRSSKAKTTETSTVCTKRQTVGTIPSLPHPAPQQQSTWRNTSWTKRPSSHYATFFFLLSARGGTENRHHLLFLHSARSKRQIHKSRNKLIKKKKRCENTSEEQKRNFRRKKTGECCVVVVFVSVYDF